MCAGDPGMAILHDVLRCMQQQLQSVWDSGPDRDLAGPGPFRRLLRSICRDYPLSGLLLSTAVAGAAETDTPLMQAMHANIQSDVAASQLLQAHFPLLLALARESEWLVFPEAIRSLVLHLQEVARRPLLAPQAPLAPSPPTPDSDNHVTFAPRFPLLRLPQQYKADGPAHDTSRDEVPCTKYSQSHPGLTPGIFAIFCPHGMCMGFVIMSRGEGPKTAFDFIFHRFAKAPKMIIYDNACNLHRYALRRQPLYFSATRFAMDRMHQNNHVA